MALKQQLMWICAKLTHKLTSLQNHFCSTCTVAILEIIEKYRIMSAESEQVQMVDGSAA